MSIGNRVDRTTYGKAPLIDRFDCINQTVLTQLVIGSRARDVTATPLQFFIPHQ
jgi:hypothetical protein